MSTISEPRRLGPRGQRLFDLALVAGLLLLTAFYAVSTQDVAVSTFSVVLIVPLLWRRRRPVAVFTTVAALGAVQVLLLDEPVLGQLAFPVATYSVARFAARGPALGALGVGLAAALVAAVDWQSRLSALDASAVMSLALLVGAIEIAAWALGTQGRTRRAFVDTLVKRAEDVEREAAQQVALAASDERARIAREMHDVVAHALSVVVVQADGARYAAAQDPSVAGATLERIAATGRSALADMRQLLGLLRSDETGTRPLPGLLDLPGLVEEAGATGDLEGLETPVSGAVALTTYRVAQEALTNVRKHAGPGARASVGVHVTADAVEITVVDDGHGAGADPSGPGHGLLGMQERVGLHGGRLRHGPRPGGGFEVVATVPR